MQSGQVVWGKSKLYKNEMFWVNHESYLRHIEIYVNKHINHRILIGSDSYLPLTFAVEFYVLHTKPKSLKLEINQRIDPAT